MAAPPPGSGLFYNPEPSERVSELKSVVALDTKVQKRMMIRSVIFALVHFLRVSYEFLKI